MPYVPPAGDQVGPLFAKRNAPAAGNDAGARFTSPSTPPGGSAVALSFTQRNAVPAGNKVALEFSPDASGPIGTTQYVTGSGLDAYAPGAHLVRLAVQFASPDGMAPPAITNGALVFLHTRYLLQRPLNPFAAGRPTVRNQRLQTWPGGFAATSFGASSIWNWVQYRTLGGYDASVYGTAFVSGGVKYVDPRGLSTQAIGAAKVINTTANQFANPPGIATGPIGAHAVSPRTLRPGSIYGTAPGFPVVQFPPQPKGWQSSAFGRPAIEYKTKLVRPSGVNASAAGYPVVRDRAQKILHAASAVTSIFGDVGIRLRGQRIVGAGFDALEAGRFAEVRSNRRYLQAAGVPTPVAGVADVRNKTPSLTPIGWYSAVFGPQHIGWRVRRINAVGVPVPLSQVAVPSLWQTPGLRPTGMAAPATPVPVVGHGLRAVFSFGADALYCGTPTVGFSYRIVALEGKAKEASLYGAVRLEHGTRTVLAAGALRDGYGLPWVSRSPRLIEPQGLPYPIDRSTPMVGGRRWLYPDGYDAARFGTRVVPERQSLYPLGFAGSYGLAQVLNVRRYLRPAGITTYQQPQDHWGRAAVWNSRQYVSMEFDPDSGLNVPAWPQWTVAENRNRIIGATGTAMARMGSPFVENGARALLPAGFAQPAFAGALLVADRIRPLFMDGLEPPHITRWTIIVNNAAVLRAAGVQASLFGQASLESNRRVVSRAGAVDVFAPGNAFIAPRVRSIETISRYAIAPPYIPLPSVQLLTRYVELASGIEPKEAGRAALQIVWRGLIPRWTHRDYFGEPRLHNVTPELQGRGWVAEEFGSTSVRLEWRPVAVVQDSSSDLFGRTRIADKRQHITPVGSDYLRFGDKLKVERFGVQPPSLQTIIVRNGGDSPQADFINLSTQVPEPTMNEQTIYVRSTGALTVFGDADVTSNGIRVEPGVGAMVAGVPDISLKIRRVVVGPFPDGEVFEPSAPRMSPLTIWAVVEAPSQAKSNHPTRSLHYVNSNNNSRPPGEVFGRPALTLRHRVVRPSGAAPLRLDGAIIYNKRQAISVTGFLSLRFGWHTVPGERALAVVQKDAATAYGRPAVAFGQYYGPRQVKPSGVPPPAVAKQQIDLFNRSIPASGFVATAMGSSRGGTAYAWQSLHVGPPMPTIPAGIASDVHGTPWVSLRVRGVEPEGADMFASEYDFSYFQQRMRVRNATTPQPPRQQIQPQGRDCARIGAPALRNKIHYIRPDGNSDQHRKGAF